MAMSSGTARNVLVKVFPLAIKIPADVGVGRSSGKTPLVWSSSEEDRK